MPAHPVKGKLEQTILPYFVAANRLKRQPLYVAYGVYVYTHDLLAFLAGIGITQAGIFVAGESGSIAQLLTLKEPWGVVLVGALAGWGILKIAVTREAGEKRSTLARSCRREFRALEHRLYGVLSKPNPIPELLQIESETQSLVDRHIAEDSWPWGPLPEGIDQKIEQRLASLSRRFEGNWTEVPTGKPVDQV